MKVEDCKYINEWDYKGWMNMSYPNPDFQNDWNQTLLTKINQTSAMICKTSYYGGANFIQLNSKLLPLIETLEYYNPVLKSLNGRYAVVVNDELEDNVIFLEHTIKDGDWENIVKQIEENCEYLKIKSNPPTLEEYKKGLRGCVKILNYKKVE